MNMMAQIRTEGELRRQSRIALELGSPFVAAVLEAGERQLDRAPRTAALIHDWPGDPAAAALAMRFNGALHALARRGELDALSALYRGAHDDYDHAIGDALDRRDGFIADWMRDPPQTNEVARSAFIAAALMVFRRHHDVPVELLELGSSCGLNLNLARYAHRLGDVATGDPASPVRTEPVWHGPSPDFAPIDVVAARGVDLSPLDPRDPATRERLLAYIWKDQPLRAARVECALDIAERHPPQVDRGDAKLWLPERLAEPQPEGIGRVVFHSMVLQYLAPADRRATIDAIERAGARATDARPLAWIALEWTPDRTRVELSLTRWPSGERQLLAVCHPYGAWAEWRAPGAR